MNLKLNPGAESMLPASSSWPFEEARKIVQRIGRNGCAKGYVLFETGYGPSGLPHLGTFGEVARTTWVRHAFQQISDLPTRLYAFSDDMDGLRKVPENVPNREMLAQHLGKPLTQIPDPFGQYPSFGHHNNARLCSFLDRFGFDYTFRSATEVYRSGELNPVLKKVLVHYDAVMQVMLPSLREERQATYSPFLPLCPETGVVLQVPVESRDVEAGTISWRDPVSGDLRTVPVTDGHCKLQWKADWAARWVAQDVDYEMSGKDLIASVKLSSALCRILGGVPPEGFSYELFLDEHNQKISKSRGNGLSMEEWLAVAPTESLAMYMFHAPRKAKKLYFDVVPRAVDDYLGALARYPEQTGAQQQDNPVWHIHQGDVPAREQGPGFGLLLNLVSVCGAQDAEVLWGFIRRYNPELSPEKAPFLDRLVHCALAYDRDRVQPMRKIRAPAPHERALMEDLKTSLESVDEKAGAEAFQAVFYEVNKRHFTELREGFRTFYQLFFGQDEGPRMGSFVELYGLPATLDLVTTILAR
jgi:lysyl-tRNA synthetase class 1